MIDVQDLIRRVSREEGIDPALALATARQESGFRPDAVGDAGCSFGLYQANRCGGAGTGIAVDQLVDPEWNARQFAGRIRGQLAAGFQGSPGELAAAAQRPYDARAYADAVNALYRQYVADAPAAAAASSTAGDIGSAIAAAPGKLAGEVGGRVAGAALDHFGSQLVVALLVLLAVVLIVGVFA